MNDKRHIVLSVDEAAQEALARWNDRIAERNAVINRLKRNAKREDANDSTSSAGYVNRSKAH